MEQKTAIIIGAGPAGLTAAYQLLKETDYHPIVLEASPYIGGISRTAEYHGNRIDLGGHRFFSKSKEVCDLWQTLMPMQGSGASDDLLLARQKDYAPGGPDPEQTERVMLLRDRVSRIYYLKKFFDYPISLKFRIFANMGAGRTLKAGFGYLGACIHKRPEDSLANFYINRFGKPLYEMFFEDYTEKLWGVNPRDISAEWGAQRVKGLSLRKTVANALTKPFRKKNGKVETSLIEQFWYPKKGPGQLWEVLCDEVIRLGGEVYRNTEVTGITLENGRVTAVQANTPDGEKRFTADAFFSTMPVKDLVCGMGEEVPQDVRQIAEALPYRDYMTVGLLVDRLKLKNQTKIKTVGNIVPDCWIYIQERGVKLGRLQIFNNWSPYMVKDPQNTVWIGLEYFCAEGDTYWKMPDDAFIAFATEELAKIGVIDADAVKDAVRIKVKKAYPAYFGSYAQFDTVKQYLDAIPNLYLIGRNGQHRYNNMDHSMLTAMEAVRALRDGTDKTAVWNVNTEQEYHESKQN